MPKLIVRHGDKALPSSGGGSFLSIKPDQSVVLAPMTGVDDMISVDQHVFWVEGGNSPMFPCIGEGCPGCALGDEPRYRASIAVMVKDVGPKIFSFGITVARQLSEIAGEVGSIKGKMMKVKRTGSGMATRYTVVALGKDVKFDGVEIPNLEESIGPTTREGILELLKTAGVEVPSADEIEITATKAESKAVSDSASSMDSAAESEAPSDWGSIS